MKKMIGIFILLIVLFIIVAVFYSTRLFHPSEIDRIVVEFDGECKTVSSIQMSEIINDFNNSIKYSDGGSEPWTCGIDEESYNVCFYSNDELIYKFAPVLDGCSSFECCYNAYGQSDFFINCRKSKKIVDILTGNPYLMSRYE